MKAYFALFRNNMRLTLRDRAILFLNYALPLVFFVVVAGLFADARGSGISFFAGAVLTMGILGNGLFGAGMRAVQEREANILRRFKVTPISPMPILVASMASGWLLYLPAVVLLIALAHFAYGMPVPERWFSLFVMTSLGVCAFRAIGLILAAVANTAQEATLLIQLLYLPMLILSGATVPAAMLPPWVQTIAEFMPASYLVGGFQGIFFRRESILDHGPAVAALLVTVALGMFLALQLFRWEKDQKIRPRKKLWILVVLGPSLLIGGYRAYTKEHLGRNRALFRGVQRSEPFLIRNARIFVGDGSVIEKGSVQVRNGKIAEVFAGVPSAGQLPTEVVEGAGKTLLPGFIDTHVHLVSLPGASPNAEDFDPDASMARAAAALLESGVTAARSVGDPVPGALKLRGEIGVGAQAGAQVFVWSPLFTAQHWRGTEFLNHLPAEVRNSVRPLAVRTPKTPEEARRQVREMKKAGVDGLKAILEAGGGDGGRLDLLLARSVAEEARLQGLPLATHTGDARDVADAVEIGSTSIEHGSLREEIPDSLLERMARTGVYFNPTLSGSEACAQYFDADPSALNRPLVTRTLTSRVLQATRELLSSGRTRDEAKSERCQLGYEIGRSNLVRAWKAGVPLVMGTDAGDPLVVHGAAFHRELTLWVAAGIPPEVALQAATWNGARLLRASNRFGAIRKGMEADLILVDGDPMRDISATERIVLVVSKGERIERGTQNQ